MNRKIFYYGWTVILILGIIGFSVYASNTNLKKEVTKEEQSIVANDTFLNAFFTYEKTRARYENIKPLTTEEGYLSVFPSGLDLPDPDAPSVQSLMTDLTQYQNRVNKNEMSFLSEFAVTTEYNKVKNTESYIVRTNLLFVDGKWKINDLQIVSQPSIER